MVAQQNGICENIVNFSSTLPVAHLYYIIISSRGNSPERDWMRRVMS